MTIRGDTPDNAAYIDVTAAGTSGATTAKARVVHVVDSAGAEVSFGGGAQFAEDAVHSSGALGTLALGVRKDTATALAGTDGDYSVLITDGSGRLHANTGLEAPVGAVDETAPASDTASSGQNGRLQRIAQRITSLIAALESPFQALSGFVAGTAMRPYGRPFSISGSFAPTGPYAQGDAVGALIELDIGAAVGASMANAWISVSLIHALARSDTPPTNIALIPALFDENPTASTWTDDATTVLAAADLAKVLPWLSVSTAGGAAVIPNALCSNAQWTSDQGLMVQCDAAGKIYLGFASAGALTFGANAGVGWRFQFGANV